jgi:hypothetical protein
LRKNMADRAVLLQGERRRELHKTHPEIFDGTPWRTE